MLLVGYASLIFDGAAETVHAQAKKAHNNSVAMPEEDCLIFVSFPALPVRELDCGGNADDWADITLGHTGARPNCPYT
jgi:hypothetical protein